MNDGHDGVTVRDGLVREFGSGVFVGRARHNRVLNVSSSRNQFVIAESARSLVRDSSGNGNPAPDGDGIGVFDSQHLRILQNSFRRNALGMRVEDSTNIVIEQSRLSRSSDFGILLTADRNQVRGNRSVGDGITGISVAPGNRNVIAYNRIFDPPPRRGGRRRRGGHRHREGTRQPGRPAT
jgi:nitrous oxidase accessory protein NosD